MHDPPTDQEVLVNTIIHQSGYVEQLEDKLARYGVVSVRVINAVDSRRYSWHKDITDIDELYNLKYWQHSSSATFDYEAIVIYLDINKKKEGLTKDNSFVFGLKKEGNAELSDLVNAIDNLRTNKRNVEKYQEAVENSIVYKEEARQRWVETYRTVKEPPKYTNDQLRDILMKHDDILDVRFAGETFHYGSLKVPMLMMPSEYKVEPDKMLVTFTGSVIRSSRGVVPLPPLQLEFAASGHIRGGPLAIHPHVRTGDACLGTAGYTIPALAEAHDTLGAVEMMKHYRHGYNHESPLNRNWAADAWNYWAYLMVAGWQGDEPFQKEWFSEGLLMTDARSGNLTTLATVLGANNHRAALSAAHIGRDATWYSRTQYKELIHDDAKTWFPEFDIPTSGDDLMTEIEYAQGYCACGRVHPKDINRVVVDTERVICTCHTPMNRLRMPSTHPCEGCGADSNSCDCTWIHREHWNRYVAQGLRVCEFIVEEDGGRCDYRSSGEDTMQVYQLTVPRGRLTYYGANFLCEAHLPSLDGTPSTAPRTPTPRCLHCGYGFTNHYRNREQLLGCPNGMETSWESNLDETPRPREVMTEAGVPHTFLTETRVTTSNSTTMTATLPTVVEEEAHQDPDEDDEYVPYEDEQEEDEEDDEYDPELSPE